MKWRFHNFYPEGAKMKVKGNKIKRRIRIQRIFTKDGFKKLLKNRLFQFGVAVALICVGAVYYL